MDFVQPGSVVVCINGVWKSALSNTSPKFVFTSGATTTATVQIFPTNIKVPFAQTVSNIHLERYDGPAVDDSDVDPNSTGSDDGGGG